MFDDVVFVLSATDQTTKCVIRLNKHRCAKCCGVLTESARRERRDKGNKMTIMPDKDK